MYDVLIVGQGLAGSLLAWSLLQQGLNIAVISDGQPSASHVAAGIINPVTGQRFVLAADAAQQLAVAKHCYQHLEQQLHIQCYFPMPILRLLSSEKEHLACQKRLQQVAYAAYLSPVDSPNDLKPHVATVLQQQTAYLDTNILLNSLYSHFVQLAIMQPPQSQQHDIQQHRHHLTYQGVQTKQLIFCEGHLMQQNPLFSWLPLQPAHGEIITCATQHQLPKHMLNQSKWLLPTDAHRCRIGATYETGIPSPMRQEKSKQSLMAFGQSLFHNKPSFELLQHQAGIRPCTQDKQPFIGFHPQYPNIGIFNGFGSRGCLLIPYYAQRFMQHLCYQQGMPNLSNIQRYHKHYTHR